jgi:hypothetical protein
MRFARLQVLVSAFVIAWPAFAFAEGGVVVEDFKGASGRKVRSVVVEILEEQGIDLISPKKAKLTAKKSGAELDSESGRVRVAKKLGASAFIEGTTKVDKKKKTEIEIKVFRGSDGMEAASFKTAVTKWAITKELNKKLWAAIGPALGGEASEPIEKSIEPPPPSVPPVREQPIAEAPKQQPKPAPTRPAPSKPAPAPTHTWKQSEPEREESPFVEQARDDEGESEALAMETHADAEEGSLERPSAIDITVGARIGTRNFGYNDSLPLLRGYSLLPSPSIALIGHWYPAAHFQAGALAHIGLDIRADYLVGVSTENDDKQKFSTNSHTLGIGVRGRIPLNQLELGVVGGWGQHAFSVPDNGAVDPDIPDVNYSFLRLGADGRYAFNQSLAVQLRTAFLYGLSLGEISQPAWFPHATGNGFELEGSFQVGVSKLLAFELALGMQRYFMSLNPETDDPGVNAETARVAGGALDKYFFTRLGMIIRP